MNYGEYIKKITLFFCLSRFIIGAKDRPNCLGIIVSKSASKCLYNAQALRVICSENWKESKTKQKKNKQKNRERRKIPSNSNGGKLTICSWTDPSIHPLLLLLPPQALTDGTAAAVGRT